MAELVTFGEAMLRYSPPVHTRLETAHSLEVSVAGAESNIAIAAARTGADTLWVSTLPENPLGRRVHNALREVGLETDINWSATGRQGIYYVESGAKPRGTDVHYDRENTAIQSTTVASLPTERIAAAQMFAITGITPALSDTLATTTQDLLSHAKAAGTRTVFDLNYRSKLWTHQEARNTVRPLLEHVDIAFIGQTSAKEVFDTTGSPEEVARTLATEWDLEALFLTRGSWGSVAVFDGTYVEQRSVDTDTVDPIGTGDAYVGGVLAGLLAGEDVSDAMAIGTALAALTRTVVGDIAIVTREEVDRVLENSGNAIHR